MTGADRRLSYGKAYRWWRIEAGTLEDDPRSADRNMTVPEKSAEGTARSILPVIVRGTPGEGSTFVLSLPRA